MRRRWRSIRTSVQVHAAQAANYVHCHALREPGVCVFVCLFVRVTVYVMTCVLFSSFRFRRKSLARTASAWTSAQTVASTATPRRSASLRAVNSRPTVARARALAVPINSSSPKNVAPRLAANSTRPSARARRRPRVAISHRQPSLTCALLASSSNFWRCCLCRSSLICSSIVLALVIASTPRRARVTRFASCRNARLALSALAPRRPALRLTPSPVSVVSVALRLMLASQAMRLATAPKDRCVCMYVCVRVVFLLFVIMFMHLQFEPPHVCAYVGL